MQISEIRINLIENRSDRLKGFCSVTFDNAFVVRDLKIIEGANGYFVAMPSRKLTDHCHACGAKNHLRARFCNDCGARLDENRALQGRGGRTKLHADIAHPINSECREMIQKKIADAFKDELERSKTPGYVPAKLDDYDDTHELGQAELETKSPEPESPSPEAAPEEKSEKGSSSEENKSGFGEGII